MNIKFAIIHTFNSNNNLSIISNKLLDINNNIVNTFITKHIEKLFSDCDFFTSALDNDDVISNLDNIGNDIERFYQVSVKFSKEIFEVHLKCDVGDSFDILVCDFSHDNHRFLCFLKLAHKTEYIHNILTDGDSVQINIENHLAILPNTNCKLSDIIIINLDNMNIRIKEKAKFFNGEKRNIYSELVFKCKQQLSPNNAIKATANIIKDISEEFGMDPIKTITKAKSIIDNQITDNYLIQPLEVGKKVFANNQQCLEKYSSSIIEKDLNCEIAQSPIFTNQKIKKHKIKTDTGIEVIFPSNYIEDGKFINVQSNADGTISIELKNIGKITNSI